jgi:hypothetical protein
LPGGVLGRPFLGLFHSALQGVGIGALPPARSGDPNSETCVDQAGPEGCGWLRGGFSAVAVGVLMSLR